MTQQSPVQLTAPAPSVDEDLRHGIEADGGDVTAALRAALIANALLLEENGRLRKQVRRISRAA